MQSLIGDYLEAELSPAERSEIEGILVNILEGPSLLLRSLVTGDLHFFVSAFTDPFGLPRQRVASLCERPSSGGFQALYARACLPSSVQPVFAAVLAAMGSSGSAGGNSAPRRRLVNAAIEACQTIVAEERGSILALLRRFESEAAREEAR